MATGDNDHGPDAIVSCGRIGGDDLFASTPVIVAEVLSPATRAVDTGVKLVGWFQLRVRDAIATATVAEGAITIDPPGITVASEEFYAA